jgi:hypothetical protein
MELALSFAKAAGVRPEERHYLIDTASHVGRWLAARGVPGRWDGVEPAALLASLDGLSPSEVERFMFYLVALLGHAAINGKVAPGAAARSLDQIAAMTRMHATRDFARSTVAQLQSGMS